MVHILRIKTWAILLLLTDSLQTGHVCNSPVGEPFCCAHYENVNGKCTKCKKGFRSDAGQPCLPCLRNYYGEKCASTCNCDTLQSCDHVEGCVHISEMSSVTTALNNSSTVVLINASNKAVSNTVSTGNENTMHIVNPPETTATLGTSLNRSTTYYPSVDEDTEIGISKMNLVIYSATASGIIFMLFMWHLYRRYRKRVSNKRSITTKPQSDDLITASNDDSEMSENIYHRIDESKMIDSTAHANPYLEVINSSASSESVASSKSIVSSVSLASSNEDTVGCYLHPYNSLIAKADIHMYVQSQPINTITLASQFCSEVVNKHNRESVSSQQIDADTADKISNYMSELQNAIVNSSETSLSELEKENRDSSGYLNPCEDMELGTEVDNKFIFDISVSASACGTDAKSLDHLVQLNESEHC